MCRRQGSRVHIIITSRLTGRGYNYVVGPPCVDLSNSLIHKFTGSSRCCSGSMRASAMISTQLSGCLLCRVTGKREGKVGHSVYKERVININGFSCILEVPISNLVEELVVG